MPPYAAVWCKGYLALQRSNIYKIYAKTRDGFPPFDLSCMGETLSNRGLGPKMNFHPSSLQKEIDWVTQNPTHIWWCRECSQPIPYPNFQHPPCNSGITMPDWITVWFVGLCELEKSFTEVTILHDMDGPGTIHNYQRIIQTLNFAHQTFGPTQL